MPRYVFPDPNDRSPNEATFIAKSDRVLGLYKQAPGETMEYVTEKVQNWFCKEAARYGWDDAYFSGNQCILTVKLSKRPLPED